MRSWHPIPPFCLDTKHLVAEHFELHIMLNVILSGKEGYKNHPETKRWKNNIPALVKRHDLIVSESRQRGLKMGFDHKTPMSHYENVLAGQKIVWPETIEPIEIMRFKLAKKIERGLL